jgi:hypothetical protein
MGEMISQLKFASMSNEYKIINKINDKAKALANKIIGICVDTAHEGYSGVDFYERAYQEIVNTVNGKDEMFKLLGTDGDFRSSDDGNSFYIVWGDYEYSKCYVKSIKEFKEENK